MPVNTSSSASRRVLVIIALVLFVAALILIFVSSLLPNTGRRLSGGSYADGFRAARELAFQSGVPHQEVKQLFGVIESVSGGSIVVKTTLFVDEKVDGVGQKRTIFIDSSTKILKQVMKEQDRLQKEQKEFMAKAKDFDPEKPAMSPVMPPLPFELVEMNVSDLKAGSQVIVSTAENEDLMLKDNIKAKEIQVLTDAPLIPTQQENL